MPDRATANKLRQEMMLGNRTFGQSVQSWRYFFHYPPLIESLQGNTWNFQFVKVAAGHRTVRILRVCRIFENFLACGSLYGINQSLVEVSQAIWHGMIATGRWL
jgi:hypothetical protein